MAPITVSSLGALSLLLSTALAASAYGPVSAQCPAGGLVRSADQGVGHDETSYISARKPVADAALLAWLTKTNPAYARIAGSNSDLPTIALTVSGGGYRSMLTGAGVIQGLDARDGNTSTSGLYQALSYQAGLSGGSWLLSSLAGNGWATVSTLRDELWTAALEQTLFLADVADGGAIDIVGDLAAKASKGFDVTLTDAWGRLLSYQLLRGDDGGVNDTLSGIAAGAGLADHTVPFPIITALGVRTWAGECDPEANATQYEFTPYEFGSWDAGVAAFTPSKYLGSTPSSANDSCVTGFDNLGFVLGTSSSLFNILCLPVNVNQTALTARLADLVTDVHELATQDLFAVYPNPFHGHGPSSLVRAEEKLHLVDGGTSNQNNPVWPLLHRPDVDVLIVSDSSSDTAANWPNGTELRNTWAQARAQLGNQSRMPDIPTPAVFVADGLTDRPTFFGCRDTAALTIVWLPNANFTFDSNVETLKLQYSANETSGMIANGLQVATQGGDARWPACLACGIMAKSGYGGEKTLADECAACLDEYCYN